VIWVIELAGEGPGYLGHHCADDATTTSAGGFCMADALKAAGIGVKWTA
jgi:hypothetical protein